MRKKKSSESSNVFQSRNIYEIVYMSKCSPEDGSFHEAFKCVPFCQAVDHSLSGNSSTTTKNSSSSLDPCAACDV